MIFRISVGLLKSLYLFHFSKSSFESSDLQRGYLQGCVGGEFAGGAVPLTCRMNLRSDAVIFPN